MRERAYAGLDAVFIDVDDQVEAILFCQLVAELNHFPELPCGVDVQQREGQSAWIKGLLC